MCTTHHICIHSYAHHMCGYVLCVVCISNTSSFFIDFTTLGPILDLFYEDERVFEGSLFQFVCTVYPSSLAEPGIQLRIDGIIVDTTANNRISALQVSDGSVVYIIAPIVIEDDGIVLECVIDGPDGAMIVSNGRIFLQVIADFSTFISRQLLLMSVRIGHSYQKLML